MNRTAVLIVTLAALVSVALYDSYSRGRAVGRAEVAARSVVIWQRAIHTRDTAYTTDTLRLRVWRDRWDTLRVTDTLWRDSVVYVRYDVVDSVIRACYAVLRSCESRVTARDSLIAALQGRIKGLADAQPSLVSQWTTRALWLAAGVGVGQVIKR